MTPAVEWRSPSRRPRGPRRPTLRRLRLIASGTALFHGGGPTLDELIVGVWEGLSAGRSVPCPVCTTGAMHPRYGAGPGPVSASCGDCGSSLA